MFQRYYYRCGEQYTDHILYCIRKNQNEALKRFAEETCYQEGFSKRFETMVYAAAAKELISTSKAASLLHSSVSTVRKHLNVV